MEVIYLKKIVKLLIFLIALAGMSVFASMSDSIVLKIVAVIATSICGYILMPIGEFFNTQGQGITTWFKSQILYRNKEVYLSFSYLYRIELNGKYLFIRGNRLKDRYQPIGGVYKYYEEAKDFLNKINAFPSIKMKNEEDSDDLRLTIKGRYYLTFINWFMSMENREYDPLREFNEELINSGILPADKFKFLKYRKLNSHNVGFTYSVPLQTQEVIYADIFELKLSNEQETVIIEAVNNYPELLCLATTDEIRSRRVNQSIEMNLGNNAPWIIGEV